MALEHAIMVSLAERSATGYDLARRFDASIGHFWYASHQQIYRVLGRMVDDAWVAADVIPQDGRPDKKVYTLTATGHAQLRDWLAEPSTHEPLRSEFAVKLRALHLIDREALLANVKQRREEHHAKLAEYRASEAKFFPDPDSLAPAHIGPYLVLRGGQRTEQGALDWCDEILAYLEAR